MKVLICLALFAVSQVRSQCSFMEGPLLNEFVNQQTLANPVNAVPKLFREDWESLRVRWAEIPVGGVKSVENEPLPPVTPTDFRG